MPTSSTTTTLFFSASRNNSQSSLRTSTIVDPFAMDSLDSKARIEFERERQKAHKGHDVRRKHSGLSIKSNHSAAPLGHPKRPGALGQGNWRNSKITMDDMDDYDFTMDGDDDRFANKENSRPSSRPVSISLEDLVIRPASGKKLRESVSRTSLSRQASTDNLTKAMANVSLILAQPVAPVLPSISELHSRSSSSMSDDSDSDSSILLSPMLPPSDYDSSTDDDLDDFDLQLDFPSFDDEFSSPESWSVAEAEDGATQFRVQSQTTTTAVSLTACTSFASATPSRW